VRKKIRIEDVAQRAGVSVATVSRVINKLPSVKPANRLKVERIIRSLKYHPDFTAQALARGHKNALGLVIPYFRGVFYSYYATEIIRSVGQASLSLGFDLLLHITNGKTFLNPTSVEGVIFADIIENHAQLKEIYESDTPCVVMNYLVEDLDVSCVTVDNLRGAREAVGYLLKLGHKKIATITGDLRSQAARLRLQGYKLALSRQRHLLRDDYILKADYSPASANLAMKKLMDLKDPPTAVFVASDEMAQEAIKVALQKKLSVPGDVSIIGFDDSPWASLGPVPLTTVKQPLAEMGIRAARLLNRIISRDLKAPARIRLPVKLVKRASCSPPRG
jgi:DNA-binding LacI/PurR family transcriptional regulator